MPRTVPLLELQHLGPTRRLAIRKLLTEFRAQGWRDLDGAALTMIDQIERSGGKASPRMVAGAAPAGFLTVNGVSRSQLSRALEALAQRQR